MTSLTMAFRNLSQREQILLLLLVGVIIGMGYHLFRYQAIKADLWHWESEVAKVQADLKAAKVPRDPPYERSRLEKKLAKLEQELQDVQAKLTPLESQFVPADNDDALLTLKLDISSLAKTTGVDIRDNQPFQPDIEQKAEQSTAAGTPRTLYEIFLHGDPYRRPLQRLRLVGSFAGLQRFLEGLPRLPNKVIVLLFRMETAGQPIAPGAPQPLSSTIILAL
ncbi:MAG: hypothetical protein D6690_02480 [Nitrospirae bacterium]|nr:MAG: hypothetical protein D6690_02480 [Nitrospirota bacterium]